MAGVAEATVRSGPLLTSRRPLARTPSNTLKPSCPPSGEIATVQPACAAQRLGPSPEVIWYFLHQAEYSACQGDSARGLKRPCGKHLDALAIALLYSLIWAPSKLVGLLIIQSQCLLSQTRWRQGLEATGVS
jgi:hypothetical protein